MNFSANVALGIALILTAACGHPASMTPDLSPDSQRLPFEGPPQPGVSPTHSILPSTTHVPEGTTITVSVERSLSSASARPNDTFAAQLADPIVIGGETVAPPGTSVTGLVLQARHAASMREPGYLRVALTTLNVKGKALPISTSSLFAKGGSREERTSASDGALISKETVFAPGRRLSFRLTQNVALP